MPPLPLALTHPHTLLPLQRWDAHRQGSALAHWRRLLEGKRAAADGLRRCLIRKRVAFRLFRQWYWESFDDDMQVGRGASGGGGGAGLQGGCAGSWPAQRQPSSVR
jgi:hypothetical protein